MPNENLKPVLAEFGLPAKKRAVHEADIKALANLTTEEEEAKRWIMKELEDSREFEKADQLDCLIGRLQATVDSLAPELAAYRAGDAGRLIMDLLGVTIAHYQTGKEKATEVEKPTYQLLVSCLLLLQEAAKTILPDGKS
jgi:hypothetical protein